ncbi:MAG: hypothetical protein K0S31_2367 [Sphingobacterium multivorum]|jgi:hypothetical protein|nr:hypothetical protein [Sphingobacterium multivorum]
MKIYDYLVFNGIIQGMFIMANGNIVTLRITIENGNFKTNYVLNSEEREFISKFLESINLL